MHFIWKYYLHLPPVSRQAIAKTVCFPPESRIKGMLGDNRLQIFNQSVMNIFVANLNFKVRSENLKEIFSEYGEVITARIITEKGSRRSKGFGFVEMANDEDAKKAINALDGAEWEGRTIIVKEALPRENNAPAAQPETPAEA